MLACLFIKSSTFAIAAESEEPWHKEDAAGRWSNSGPNRCHGRLVPQERGDRDVEGCRVAGSVDRLRGLQGGAECVLQGPGWTAAREGYKRKLLLSRFHADVDDSRKGLPDGRWGGWGCCPVGLAPTRQSVDREIFCGFQTGHWL